MKNDYYTVFTNKGACEICKEIKPGCRVVWKKWGISRADDEAIGIVCKKDIQAFKEKHKMPKWSYIQTELH